MSSSLVAAFSQQYFYLTPNQHQPAATSQPVVFFSHNKSASATSHTTANTAIDGERKTGALMLHRSCTCGRPGADCDHQLDGYLALVHGEIKARAEAQCRCRLPYVHHLPTIGIREKERPNEDGREAKQPGRTGRPKFHVEIKDGGHEVRSGPGAGGGRTCRPPSSRGSKGKASSSSVHHVALHCLATARNDRFVRLPRAFRCRLQLRHQRARDGASRWLPLPSLWLCVTVTVTPPLVD